MTKMTPAAATHTEVETPQGMIAHNLRILREARGPKIVLMDNAALAAAGSSIELFLEALALPHMRAEIPLHNCHVVGRHISSEQMKGAIHHYEQQQHATTGATLKRLRKGWRQAHNARQPYAAGIFMFILRAHGMTVDDLKKQLIPPARHASVHDFRHESGLMDQIVLVSSDPEGLAELEFKTAMTHIDRVHEVTATVLDTADPEGLGRIRMRLRFLHDGVDETRLDQFPWCPRSPDVTGGLKLPAVGSTVIAQLRINTDAAGEYNVSYKV